MKKKLLLLFTLLYCIGFSHRAIAQQKISLQQALTEIRKVYGTKFSYQTELVDGIQVTLKTPLSKTEPVESVLKKILYPNGFLFLYVQENYFTLVRDNRVKEGNTGEDTRNIPEPNYRVVTGIVSDGKGKPVVGATVMPEGSSIRQGVITSSDGRYTLRLLQKADALIVSYVGMIPTKIPLGTGNIANVTLDEEQNMLEEVAVLSNGYTKLPKDRTTGAYEQLTAKQIKEVPSVSILEKLEGTMPGVQVDLRANTIRIRGVNSFGTGGTPRSPLIVIDGFPVMESPDRTANLTDAASAVSGSAILNRYNPEDIESITVLKDGAAASIWGAKAGNGVIVIETKKGRNGLPTINFGANFSVSAPADLNQLKTMNSAQYIDLESELKTLGFVTDNAIKPSWANINVNAPFGEALEWMFRVDRGTATAAQRDEALSRLSAVDNKSQIRDLLLQQAISQQYNLSLSGGSNKSTYYLSTNYTKDIPIFKKSLGESFFINTNITNKLFNDRVNLALGMNYIYSNSVNNQAAVNAIGNSNLGLRPYELLQDENGNNISRSIRFRDEVAADFAAKGYLPWTYSPVDDLNATDNVTRSNRLRFNLNLDTKIIDGVTFAISGALQRNIEDSENTSNANSYYVRDLVNYGTTVATNGKLIYGVPNGGVLGLSNYDGWEYNVRAQANVNKNIGNFANLTFLAGTEMRQTKYQSSSQTRYGFDPDTYSNQTVNPTIQYATVDGYSTSLGNSNPLKKSITRALSYYSNAALSFLENRYVVSGSVRFDDFTLTGASRNQRAKPLWSAGVKWNTLAERFMQNVNWLSGLDFRLTYGVGGTVPGGIGNVVVINNSIDNLTNEQTAYISAPLNNQITWEKVKSFNMGTDLSILKNRLSFNFDVYSKRTSDILYRFPFNPTYGWSSLEFNSSSMKSHGIDLGVKAEVIKSSDYSWTSLFNFSYNTNEVTDNRFIQNATSNQVSNTLPKVGMPFDYMYAYRWAGLDEQGQSQIYNKAGEKISSATGNNVITADDLVYQGRVTAPYFGGFNNDFKYKNFNLGVRISYSMGNVLRRPSIQNYPSYTPYTGTIGSQADLADRWKKPGDEAITNVPGLQYISFNSQERYRYSDLLTISGSYIRLQQISLGYNAPAALLKGTPIKSANVSGSVRNLGLIWRKNKDGVDPSYIVTNSYSNLPPTKAFFISVNASF